MDRDSAKGTDGFRVPEVADLPEAALDRFADFLVDVERSGTWPLSKCSLCIDGFHTQG